MTFLDERAGLAGRVAVVAGGAGGLGRAISLDLARAGVALAVCDVDDDALETCAAEAEALGVEVLAERVDVRETESLHAFFDRVDLAYDRLDALVNVVGGTFHAPFLEVRPRGVDALVRTNFTWLVDAIGLAAGRMAAGGGGSVINLTSIEAHRAAPGYAVYSAMKAAVTQLTRVLAVELGPAGVRVNCIAPDIVPTEGMGLLLGGRDADGADPFDTMAIPLGRYGRAEDVGNCALFLASDLSSYVTGTTLHPDGGALAASGWLQWPDGGWAAPPAGGGPTGAAS